MSKKKLNYKKEFPEFYRPSSKKVEFVDVPEMRFFMIDGKGNPNNSEDYQEVMQTLYGVSFGLKMDFKKKPAGRDYVVPPLEGLWDMDIMEDWSMDNKDGWQWTMMIRIPDFVPQKEIKKAIERVRKKKPEKAKKIDKLRVETYHEGKCAQIMHIGPYDAEGPTVEKLHKAIKEKDYELEGHHHEIYIGDPRRAKPENLKTIIRQPYQ